MIKSLTGICAWCFFVHLVWNAVTLPHCVSVSLWLGDFFFSYSVINYCIIFVWSNFFFTLSNYLHVGFPDFLLDIHHLFPVVLHVCFFFFLFLWCLRKHYISFISLIAVSSAQGCYFIFISYNISWSQLAVLLILLPFNIILPFMIPNSSFINAMPSGNLLQMPCFFHENFLWPFINFWRYFLL